MLSTAALGLRTGLDFDLVSANKRYHRGLLARLCTIAITRGITGLNRVPLSRLQALLPRLSLIHVQASRNFHHLCQIFPEILIADDPDTLPPIELLKKQQSDDGRVHMISNTASRESSRVAQRSFELSSSGEAVDLELWKFAVESALINTSPHLMKVRNCAIWLATLLTDIESARDKPEIKLSWHLSVGVETFMGSRRECVWYLLEVRRLNSLPKRKHADNLSRRCYSVPMTCASGAYWVTQKYSFHRSFLPNWQHVDDLLVPRYLHDLSIRIIKHRLLCPLLQ